MIRTRRTGRAAGSASRSVPSPSCWASTTRRSRSGRQRPEREGGFVVRLLIFMLGMLTADRPGRRAAAAYAAGYPGDGAAAGTVDTDLHRPGHGSRQPGGTAPLPMWPPPGAGVEPPAPGGPWGGPARRRRRIPLLVKWSAVLLVLGLIFRRAIAF